MEMHHINNLDFAKRLQTLEGDVPFDLLQRLNALLEMDGVSEQSRIRYQLAGQAQKYQLPSLHLLIDATLPMVCQRCLESMHVPLKLQFDYVISAEIPESLDDIDDMDWVEASVDMDLQALIEDELLIALPIAPVHQTVCKQLTFESGEKVNPFSVLKNLKKE